MMKVFIKPAWVNIKGFQSKIRRLRLKYGNGSLVIVAESAQDFCNEKYG